jgi:hypothetical protein
MIAVFYRSNFGDWRPDPGTDGPDQSCGSGSSALKGGFFMRIVAFIVATPLLMFSGVYPAAAQDKASPSVQSGTSNETVGRDWKAKPTDDHQTAGNATGKSPDSANQDDTQKVDRDWQVKPNK